MNDGPQSQQATDVAARPKLMPVVDTGEFAELLDSNRFGQIQRVAQLFSESDLIPEIFQGKPANCAVALQMAFRMRVDPMMLMQNMYIVHGKPGIEAKLAIALINTRGPFEGPIQWSQEGEGDKRSWTAYAVHRVTGQRCQAAVTWAMVHAEGWDTKSGSKWKSIPDMMGMYRSAMFLGRLYCPEVLLGLPSDDELRDIGGGSVRSISGERVDAGAIQMPQARIATEQTEGAGEVQPVEREMPGPELKAAETGTVTPPLELEGGATMGTRASEAQRNMIINIAKRQGVTVAQLDDALIDKFTMGIDELPVGLVGDATVFVKTLKAAAA